MRTSHGRGTRASDKPATGRLIGYARVSTDDQDLNMQLDRLRAAGCHDDRIYTDKLSGVARRRPGLDAALMDCVEGDTLVVWRLDRLGRSTLDLLTKVKGLKARGVGFRSLTESIDTETIVGELLLAVLGAVAQFERDLIAERTRTAIAVKKSNGAVWGAVQKLDVAKAAKMLAQGKTPRQVQERFKLRSISTVYHYFNKAEVEALREDYRAKKARKR